MISGGQQPENPDREGHQHQWHHRRYVPLRQLARSLEETGRPAAHVLSGRKLLPKTRSRRPRAERRLHRLVHHPALQYPQWHARRGPYGIRPRKARSCPRQENLRETLESLSSSSKPSFGASSLAKTREHPPRSRPFTASFLRLDESRSATPARHDLTQINTRPFRKSIIV